jgi:ATP-binding cassette, subfamily B, bacterial
VPPAWKILVDYLRPQWRGSMLLAVLLLGGIGLELANPQLLRAFIDTAAAGGDIGALVRLAAVFLVVAVGIQALAVGETYVAENIGLRATNALRADLTLHCLRLDANFLNSHTPGELIERVDGDVGTLANFFSRFVVYVVGNTLLLLGLLVALAVTDLRVGLVLGASMVLALLAMNALRAVAVPHWAAARQASAELFGFLEERLTGTEDIRASGATPYVMRRFFERSRMLVRRDLVAGFIGNSAFQSAGILLTVGTALALGFGATLFLSGAITLGSVYLIFAYTQLLIRPLEQITRQMQDLQMAGAGLARIEHLMRERSSIPDGWLGLPSGPLDVELEHVTFGYTPEEPVLRDLCLRLRAGEVLGVLGRTGIGKTTLAKLLLRLYLPDSGTIRLAGLDLGQVRESDLRRRVSLVTQEIQVFNASLRDNLSLFDASLSDAAMLEVIDDLGLRDWFGRLPAGLDTHLAHGAVSAGEAQLLAFARVFLKFRAATPGLVILDEASSRLDPATERHVQHAVHRLLSECTGIVIAHRLETIERVDHVLILDAQGIREFGPRHELIADPQSTLAALLRTRNMELLA